MKNLKFKCACGHEELEEILGDVTQTSPITSIPENGNIEYDQARVTYDGGEVEQYVCAACGRAVMDRDGSFIDDSEGLVEWLKDQPYNQPNHQENEIINKVADQLVGMNYDDMTHAERSIYRLCVVASILDLDENNVVRKKSE